MTKLPRWPAAALAVAVALALAACDAEDTSEPDTGTSAPGATATPETTGPTATTEPAVPVELAVAEAFAPRYECLQELPDAQWLVGDSEGIEVAAGLAGSGDTLVVLGHQSDGHPCSFTFLAQRLIADGYQVALPAYRGGDPIGLQLGIVDFALAAGTADVVLGGASMGATYAIGAAAQMDPAPVAVIALSPALEFDPSGQAFPPVNAEVAAAQLSAPLLLMVGEHDTAFVSAAERIGAAAGVDPVVVETGGHGIDLLGVDDVAAQVLDFIASPG